MPNDFLLEESEPDFLIQEGFARVTRNGHSDIYVVQNQEYPGGYKVSLAFALDDFDPSNAEKLYGEPLVLNENDSIDFLGDAQEYFLPKAPLWGASLAVVAQLDQEVGLLPAVRAIEALKTAGQPLSQEEVHRVVEQQLADYHRRRALLIAA